MKREFLEEIAQFIRFDDSDGEALIALLPLARPHFHDIIERFYARIQKHAGAVAVLRNDAQVTRLKLTLRRWLDELLAGPWDAAYCETRARVGRMHIAVGLDQRYTCTGIAVIRSELIAIAIDVYAADRQARERAVHAINRVLDLDLTIMLESYREDSLAAVRRVQQVDHEQRERKLRLSEELHEAVIENAEVLIVAISHSGSLVMFNRKAEMLSEYSRTDLVGKPVFATLCPFDYEHARRAFDEAFAGRLPPVFECRLVSRRGHEHWIRWHVTVLTPSDDPVGCAIGVDVTDERGLQQRTQRAEQLASLGALAAGLAHEIRNPLNSAQLQLMLVERRVARELGDGTGALQAALTVRQELHRLARLVEDFLAFARPHPLRISSGDLCDTVSTVVSLLQPEAEEAGVVLAQECHHATVVLFDEGRIKQVLLNLVRNAIQAASGGTVAIEVQRTATQAVFEVRDTGAGVPENVDIFEPFITTKTSGTGLGLSIVQRIVADHGGDIEVLRTDGWTVFRVALPLEGPMIQQ